MPRFREMTDEEQRGLAAKLRELADAVELRKPLLQEVGVNVIYRDGDTAATKGDLLGADIRIEWPDPRLERGITDG